MNVRDLYFRVAAIDQATHRLGLIKKDADALTAKTTEIQAAVVDRATAPLQKIAAAADTAQKQLTLADFAASKAAHSVTNAGYAGSRAASGIERSAAAAQRLSGELNQVDTAASQVTTRLASMKSGVDSVEGGARKMAAVTGAISGVAIYKAANYQELIRSIQNRATTETATALTAWVKEGQTVEHSSGLQRARVAAQMAAGTSGSMPGLAEDPQKMIAFLEQLETTLAVQGSAANPNIHTLEGVQSQLNSFLQGNVESLNEIVPGYKLSSKEIQDLREQYRKTMPELKKFSDAEIDTYIAMDRATAIMAEANEGKEAIVDPTVRLKLAYEKLGLEMGDHLLPAAEAVVDIIGRLVEIAMKYPDATKWVAYAIAIAFVGSSAVLIMGQVLGAALALSKFGLIAKGLAAGLKVLAAAQWLLNIAMTANPIGIIIVVAAALLAVLIYLAHRSGLLAKIWERLGQLDLGGLLSRGIETATGAWDGFLDTLQIVWDRLRSLKSGMGAAGAIGLAMHMVMPAAIVAALGKRIPDLLTWIWGTLLNTKDDLAGYFRNLLPDWFTRIVDWLRNMYAKLKEVWAAAADIPARIKTFLVGSETEAGLADKIGEVILKAFSLVPGAGSVLAAAQKKADLQALTSRYAEQYKAGQIESVRGFLGRETGIVRTAADNEVVVPTFQPKEGLERDELARALEILAGGETMENAGQQYMAYPTYAALPPEEKALFEMSQYQPKILRTDLGEGYNLEAHQAFMGLLMNKNLPPEEAYRRILASPTPLPTVEEPSAMTEGVPGTATPPPEIAGDVGPTGIVPAAPQSSVSEIASFAGSGTAPADVVMLLPEDVGLPPTEVEGEGLIDRVWRYLGGGSEEVEALQSGGGVETTGGAVVHAGEEYSPAQVVHKTTVAERLADTVLKMFGSTRGAGGGYSEGVGWLGAASPVGSPATADDGARTVIIIEGPLIHNEKIETAVDINDLLWRIRRQLADFTQRDEAQYYGG